MTRKELKKEVEKLKTMNLKDKFWYLGAYYKIPLLILLAALFLLWQAADAFSRSRQDCMLYCAFINQTYAGEENIEIVQNDFYTSENFSKRQTLTFDASIDLTDDLYRNASSILFQSLIGTDTVDIVITKKEIMDIYHDQNVFLDLRSLLSDEQISRFNGELYYDTNAGGQSVPMGIYLRNSILPAGYGLDEDSILSVCTLKNHPEIIVNFIDFIFP